MASSSSNSRTCSSLTVTDDILLEIFTYLPLNSICKFKCLSKVWLSNLSSPNFIIKWFLINNKSLPWIHYHTIDDEDDYENPLKFKMAYPELHSGFIPRRHHGFSFEFLINEKPFQGLDKVYLLGSSNGLVLCYSYSFDDQDKRYHVCNPLTQKWVSLPSPPCSPARRSDVSGIFCEHSSLLESCFKVVRIRGFLKPSTKKLNVDIFSSDLGVWESFEVSSDENVAQGDPDIHNAVILNSVLFWIEGSSRMLVYNLNQIKGSDAHQCSLINFPDMEFGDDVFGFFDSRIGESEGLVCYAKTRVTARGMTVSIWVLDEVNWQVLHNHISLDDIVAEVRSRTGDL
ncbi:F-box protein At5g07610-like [Papaver somniferum]|uniref:F-box protein At5g07610-like n=1 Tax=Papaver somniferum TaxID=3469 RepID=UPI000E6FD149|nr:F-box protein At5g07610-like [Papaver somniferum]XP_026427909.1 F-box protein At5g07610-like [Papaver somniferum]XP_026427910.1 F-box protein At5g07610-like [Papaver somniferum]XP_026427911.1 F-box protein At5g07610-like [Papaver somniferum]XP_026427913.1 F-box protein At5g07610-like [Papaver somniferum]XP_026427914.1 F-box protein At5g07610-like [Papaver somniferum]